MSIDDFVVIDRVLFFATCKMSNTVITILLGAHGELVGKQANRVSEYSYSSSCGRNQCEHSVPFAFEKAFLPDSGAIVFRFLTIRRARGGRPLPHPQA